MNNGFIRTALGDVDPSVLGPTSMHDHVLTQHGEVLRDRYLSVMPQASTDRWEEPLSLETRANLNLSMTAQRANLCLDDEEIAVAELRDFKQAGGNTLVEASGIGFRGDVRRMAEASAAAGVNIVLSTGHYTADFWPEAHCAYSVEQLVDLMVAEIGEGIDGTAIRAGHIKCGVSVLNDVEERQLVAAAKASQLTGAMVTVHPGSDSDTDGRRVANIMLNAGMDPAKLVLAHADAYLTEHMLYRLANDPSAWEINLDYHRELL